MLKLKPSSSNIESNILTQFKFALSEVSISEVSETLYSLKSRKCGGDHCKKLVRLNNKHYELRNSNNTA